MAPTYKLGNQVRILQVPPSVDAQMPAETRQLFHRCVGQILRIDGIGEYGHLELNVLEDGTQAPDGNHHTIWIEPEFVASA